ncbi:MAG: hypothetical protein PVI03_05530 [Candidatus Thorarchaeota archaeon]|jgi:hypothetical protein
MDFPGGLALKDKEGNWIRRWVDKETYTYVRQLEASLQNPETFKQLKERYPERFK